MSNMNQDITPTVIANIDHIKQLNFATIYKVIEQHAPISRVEIAKISKLAPASVTKITRQLLENGIITETERQASTGGRRAISLAPNTDKINVIAIKLGQHYLSIGHYNLSGKNINTRKIEISTTHDSDTLIEFVIAELAKFMTQPALINEKISAIALTLSGLVNPKRGVVVYTPTYPLKNFPLVERIEHAFNIPTFIGNHTRSLALAENYFGATQDCLDSILISIHHGVGSGVIIEDKELLGKNCNIGEIGHIQANPNGNQCHCGNIGCLETEVSDKVIFEKVKQRIVDGEPCSLALDSLNIERIYQAASKGDPLCQAVTLEAATYLGTTIAMLVNMLNPEKIVIAGKIIQAEDTLFSTIDSCIKKHTLPSFYNQLSVIPAALKPDSTIAAFSLIKQALFEADLLLKIKV